MKFKNAILFSIICLSGLSCKKEKFKIDNLNGGRISVIGHAACGFSSFNNPVPDNSMTGIKKAIEAYGAEGVELDVQMSSDSVFYLFHNSFLHQGTDMEGCIYLHTSTELNNAHYLNTDEKIATLEECLIYFSAMHYKPRIYVDSRLLVECDLSIPFVDYADMYATKLCQLIAKYNASSWVTIEARDPYYLNKIKSLDPQVELFYDGDITEGIPLVLEYGYKGIIASSRTSTAELVKAAHNKGIYVGIFEAYTRKETKEAIRMSPDFIQSDNILQLKQLLNECQ